MFRHWLSILASFHRMPFFGQIWLIVAGLGFYTLGAVILDQTAKLVLIHAQMHTLLGTVLGLLLVFRTNTAYDRWWEGRKLWGQLVNDSRNFAIKLQTCVRADPGEKRELALWLVDFAVALKEHLRGGLRLQQLDGFANSADNPVHVPAYLAKQIYDRIESWRQADQLGGFELLFLDRHAAALMDVCGACERILKTPISRSYRSFIRQSVGIYLLTLPWALAEDFHYWAVPAVMLIGYFMVGTELLAEDVEQPFGTGADDLQLDEICEGIRRSVREIVG